MDLQLTGEQRDLRALARSWAQKEISPFAAAWDRAERVDPDIVAKLGDMGFLGLSIAEEHGGSGGNALSYCLMIEELGRADSAIRGIVSVSLGLVTKTIAAHGSPAQRERFLPRLTAGAALGCFALTEPDTGSDAAALRTRALPDGDSWRVNGTKVFITNGTTADVALLFARTGGPGPKGITAFLIPTDTPGLTRREIHGKLGLRGQATAELTLQDVQVPDNLRLGEVGGGFTIAMSTLDRGRMSVAAGCVGVAQACLDASIRYAGQREQFGTTIAHHQLVQELLADMAVGTEAARLMVWRVADLIDRGQPFATAASMAKLYASQNAVSASNAAIQVFGGYGYLDENPVGKFARDARVTTLYEGTSQIQKLLIGRALTGVSAFT